MSWLGFCLLISIFLGHGVDTEAPEGITENKEGGGASDSVDGGGQDENTGQEVTVTEEQVTFTTISLRISCNPECPQSWGFAANISLANQPATPCDVPNAERRVRCAGLQPASDYTARIYINQEQHPVTTKDIRTRELEVTVTEERVTSTTISFRISCHPECLQDWGIAGDISLAHQTATPCNVSNAERTVTCSGLRPASDYTVRGGIYINNITSIVREKIIRTNEPARCKKPEAAGLSTTAGYGESYKMGDSLKVRCVTGYRPSPEKITCVADGDGAKWGPTPQCIEKCRKPGSDETYTFTEARAFYDTGAQVTVRCNSEAYRAEPEKIQCKKGAERDEWNHIPQCIEKCRKPGSDETYTFTEAGDVYDTGAQVTVRCNREAHRAQPEKIQCKKGAERDDWSYTPQCIEKCKKPESSEPYTFTENRAFYDPGARVTVRCKDPAYRAEPERIQCQKTRERDDWSHTPHCIGMCQKPTMDNMASLSPDADYYYKWDVITVRCNSGYYPPFITMTCDRPRTGSEWISTVTCTRVTMSVDEVSSSSVSLLFSCLPECPQSWRFHVGYSPARQTGYTRCDSSAGRRVTCSGLQPASNYNIQGGITINWQWYTVPTTTIRTQESAPDRPQITKRPTLTDPVIKWNISTSKGAITGYQMNISAWRDYDPSFSEADSRWFPANVTEYKIPLQYGTNYTITLRGFTAAGAGEITSEKIETEIGGVTMSVDEVSSSSVSLLFSCHPECPQSWRFHVRYSSATQTGYTRCGSSAERRMRCSGLQPASNYTIMGGITINGRYHSVTTATIRTKESGPKITKHPTISDPIMKWNLSDSKEAITGFQMNLSAWRDYDPSFSEADSRWFLAFVTEYILPLKYGTSYTISLRGFTAAGAGEITSENIETEIGDPPPHMENTLHDQTVQLHPLHNPHGPISSYEVIVFSSQEENLTSDCLRLRNVVYNSSLSPGHYTAALLTAKNLTASRPFTLGDNQYYNGFHNAPLTPGHNYTVYIRVTSSWRRIKKSSCAFAGFLTALTADRAALPFMVVLLLSSFVLIILYLVPTVLALLAMAFIPSCKNSSTTRSQRRTEGAENNDDRDYENLQEDESKL